MSASLEQEITSTRDSSDSGCRLSALDSSKLWHSSAPRALRSAWKASPHGDAWRQWGQAIGGRRLPGLLLNEDLRTPHPLEWGAGPELAPWLTWRSELATLLESGRSQLAKAVESWVDDADRRPAEPVFALECLTWASCLPALANPESASVIESEVWWRLLDHLAEIARQTFDVSLGEDPSADSAYAHQALGGELPQMLANLAPEIQPIRQLYKPAGRLLTEGVLALTDGEGMPTGRVVGRLPLLVACWTRCRAWAEERGKPLWNEAAETQYEWLVRQMLRLASRDGRLAFSDASTIGAAETLDIALDLAGDKSDYAAAAARTKVKAYAQAAGKSAPPEPSVNSEWSGIAVLASDWAGKSQRAAITYSGSESFFEYSASGAALLSGRWDTQVSVNGKILTPIDEWDEHCWYTDDDCDYLELSLGLEDGAKLERQVLVAREDRVAYLADLVLTNNDKPAEIVVTVRLPLAHGVEFAPSDETREGSLSRNGKTLAGIVPAALPEWRVDPRHGELTQEDGCMVLRQQATGRNLCCPLFLDAWPSRFRKQRTWRQLTVAQSLTKVADDVAVGYRYQSGKDQWVTYRSLDQPANRTVIGHNTASESLFGRFLKSGEVDEFFEIDNE